MATDEEERERFAQEEFERAMREIEEMPDPRAPQKAPIPVPAPPAVDGGGSGWFLAGLVLRVFVGLLLVGVAAWLVIEEPMIAIAAAAVVVAWTVWTRLPRRN